jgi:hypothetical protein
MILEKADGSDRYESHLHPVTGRFTRSPVEAVG